MVQNFAAQAVIAIENARLLNELGNRTDDQTESLRMTAKPTLKLSAARLSICRPCFSAPEHAVAQLCTPTSATYFVRKAEILRLIATHYTPPAFDEARRRLPMQPNR